MDNDELPQFSTINHAYETMTFRGAAIVLFAALLCMTYVFAKGTVNGTRPVPRSIHAMGRIAFFTEALELYKQDFDTYPSQEAGLQALIENSKQQNYLSRYSVPKDPWGHEYIYTSSGAPGHGFEIVSYGADASPGGFGEDADVRGGQQLIQRSNSLPPL